MIALEPWLDGFVLTIEGRAVVKHSTKLPGIYVGVAKRSLISSFISREAQDLHISWRSIGALRIERDNAFHSRLHAGSGISIDVSHRNGLVFFTISNASSPLRFKLNTGEESEAFGLGPSPRFNLKHSTVTIPSAVSAGLAESATRADTLARSRVPVVYYSNGLWMVLEDGLQALLRFGDGKTDIESRTAMKELVFGYGGTNQEAMARLTGFKYGHKERWSIPFESGGKEFDDFLADDDWSRAVKLGLAYLLSEDETRSEDFMNIIQSLAFAGLGCICFPIHSGSIRKVLELAMFSPLFLTKGELEIQDPLVQRLFSRALGVFEALAPYRGQCIEDWKSEGLPFFSHPWIRYGGQKELLEFSDCLMIGKDLLVSESSDSSDRIKTLTLPDDDWVHIWTSRRFAGGRLSIDAPPGVPAVFYREKSRHRLLFEQIRRMATRL